MNLLIRSMMKQKKIILDEIKKLSETKTIIIISHNVNDLKDCDKIIDLNKR